MTDRPILFSGPMVRALLEGRKVQTRRVLKTQPPAGIRIVRKIRTPFDGPSFYAFEARTKYDNFAGDIPVSYAVNDRLYVRERVECANGEAIGYPADGSWLPNDSWRWRRKSLPSIHMPRWLSRLTLIVTDVRVQRVQDVSEADAWAEGCNRGERDAYGAYFPAEEPDPSGIGFRGWDNARDWFADLWDDINAKPRPRLGDDGKVACYESFPWEGESRVETYRGKPHHVIANPWVAAYTFTVQRGNIDEVAA